MLAQRLRLLDVEPPRRRYGRVFVGSARIRRAADRSAWCSSPAWPSGCFRSSCARIRCCSTIAARSAGCRPRCCRPTRGATRAPAAATGRRRGDRAALHLVSRLELGESRPRVPSFYALDVVARGHGQRSRARRRWPARPRRPRARDWRGPRRRTRPRPSTISSTTSRCLQRLFREKDGAATGHAHYLLKLNAHLSRAVIERWSRSMKQWSPADGVMRTTDATRPLLEQHRLTARPYSLSALQRYAACPYQFLLSAIYRLAPVEEPVPLQRMDPLTRGSLFHSIQTEFFRTLRARRPASDPVGGVGQRDVVARRYATWPTTYRDELAPAIARVWDDEMRVLERDLLRWLDHISPDPDGWEPWRFEFAFGLPDDRRPRPAEREPSRHVVDGRFLLRGSIDLVERHPPTGGCASPITRRGRTARTRDQVIDGGGPCCSRCSTAWRSRACSSSRCNRGRLFFCTSAGGLLDRTRFRSSIARARWASRRSRSSIARSSAARLRPRPPRTPAPGVTSGRCAGPSETARTRRKHSRAARRPRGAAEPPMTPRLADQRQPRSDPRTTSTRR